MSVCLSHSGLPPCLNEPQQGVGLSSLAHHVHPPLVFAMVEASLDVGFHSVVLSPTLPRDRELLHGLPQASLGSIPNAASQNVLLVDRFESSCPSSLHQRLFDGRYPKRAPSSTPFGSRMPSDQCGSVALSFESVSEVFSLLFQVPSVFSGTDVLYAIGCLLVDVSPPFVAKFLVEPLLEMTDPLLLLGCCFLCSSPQ